MVGKNHLKLIKSLHQKKYRNQHQLFFVEGLKAVKELLNSNIDCHTLFVTQEHLDQFESYDVLLITESELQKISALKSANGVLGVFHIPKPDPIQKNDWILALDNIRDPGNLGTIVRLCDWFGIRQIICSEHSVDCFNPKVVQATMGSLARVKISYQDLKDFIAQTALPAYGAFMDGESIYSKALPKMGILVMGNEAKGISTGISQMITEKISIPHYGNMVTESLNVATATAILLSEIRREHL
ncbi:MAG: RNA methyltransferase [Croceitalea sp.]|nr:RNA methyltransferase [Croceitalea sp.]